MSNQSLQNAFDKLVRTGHGWSLRGVLRPFSEGSLVQPPTFATKNFSSPYDLKTRRVEGQDVPCVTLNTVASETNAMEEAVEEVRRSGSMDLFFPVIELELDQLGQTLSTAELPHRCVAAQLRDAELDGTSYRESDLGRAILDSNPRDMTGILLHDPRSILHGVWDSHAFALEKQRRFKLDKVLRLQRLLLASCDGINARVADRRGQLEDPLHFSADLPLKSTKTVKYKDNYYEQGFKGAKADKVSEAGLSAVPVGDKGKGGVSMDYALYEAQTPMGVLRRYRFPVDGVHDPERDHAARSLLAALSILTLTLRLDRGFNLRSGCDLLLDEAPSFTFHGHVRNEVLFQGEISSSEAYALYERTYAKMRDKGLEWEENRVYTLLPCKAFQERIEKNLSWAGKNEE